MDRTEENIQIVIREERPEDRGEVRLINEAAFGRREEAQIVEELHDSCGNLLSLVATAGDRSVGHILFSPVALEGPKSLPDGMGLAPMAVLPEYQGQGIGSRLVREGLGRLQRASIPFVIVVGHPSFYSRFGFRPASRYGIRCQWPNVPDAAFMILVFDEAALEGVSGVARYREEFDRAM
jgi:putative acetyltransferase